MRRRDFITLFGGTAAAWPPAARAQQGERVRRIGILASYADDDRVTRARFAGFQQELERLGWSEGRNIRIDYRFAHGSAERARGLAKELVALQPDVMFTTSTMTAAALQRESRVIPIVFLAVSDPIGSGFIASLARPGGNITGFMTFEYGIGAKWLELLREIAPQVRRAMVLRDATITMGIGLFGAMQSVAPSLGIELSVLNVRDAGELERAVTEFASGSTGGGLLVLPGGPSIIAHRDRIISLAARQRLPAIYPFRYLAEGGGLISYGPDTIDPLRRAATYVDRILKGERPADLPVQAPIRYQLVINLKTAKALGLDVPAMLLARADEVIE